MIDYAHYGHAAPSAGPSENFAGFGARRLQRDAEEQERERQRSMWEHAEQQRLEMERRQMEEDQRRWYHQQQANAAAASYGAYHDPQAQGSGSYASGPSRTATTHEQQGSLNQSRNPYSVRTSSRSGSDVSCQDAYEQAGALYSSPLSTLTALPDVAQSVIPARHRPHQRSGAFGSASSVSTAGLAYNRSSVASSVSQRFGSASKAIGSHMQQQPSIGSVSSGDSSSLGLPGNQPPSQRRSKAYEPISFDRETRYEDDFEEGSDDADLTPAGWASIGRFSHYTGSNAGADALHTSGLGKPGQANAAPVSSQDSALNRSTMFASALPKAKCADCGDHFSFEELSDHTCGPRTAGRPALTLTISVPPRNAELVHGSPNLSSGPSTAALTPRSPFFDKYSHVVGDGGHLSPAFGPSTPGSTRSEFIAKFDAVEVERPSSSQSQNPTAGALPAYREPILPSMQRSASDGEREAVERRKKIEQQRAAKKQAGAAAAATTVIAALRWQNAAQEHRDCEDAAKGTKTSASAERQGREQAHLKQPSSSSTSSNSSSHLDPLFLSSRPPRQRETSHGTSSSAALTPSSSYDRFTETNTSPTTSTASDSPAAAARKAGSAPSDTKAEIDLAGIEDLMKGLTTSPRRVGTDLHPDDRNEIDKTIAASLAARTRSGPGDRAAAATESAERLRQERERQRELERDRELESEARRRREYELDREIERLKEKEKMRQLLRLRKREQEARQRAKQKCCVCSCSLSSSRTPFVERDGKLLCAKDWKELYLPKCRKCGLSVEKGAVKSSDGALKGVFHRACFSCYTCERPFDDGSFYVHGNQSYCAKHYHQVNGTLCKVCGHGVEGDCRQTDSGDRFHPQCFRCEYDSKGLVCREMLSEYYFVDGRRLCERHAEKVNRKLQRQGKKVLDLRADRRKTLLRTV